MQMRAKKKLKRRSRLNKLQRTKLKQKPQKQSRLTKKQKKLAKSNLKLYMYSESTYDK